MVIATVVRVWNSISLVSARIRTEIGSERGACGNIASVSTVRAEMWRWKFQDDQNLYPVRTPGTETPLHDKMD